MSASGPDDPGSLTPRERRALTRRPGDGLIIAVLASAGVISSLMGTIVVPLIPHLPELLQTNRADAAWVLTVTLLVATVSIPISGRLGDMFGKRRVHIALLGFLLAGSVVSALSYTLIPMVIGRALQGVGIGVVSLGISILRDTVHPKRLGTAVALVSATLGIGGALALPLAAGVAEFLDYHLLFWLAAGLAALCIVAVIFIVPVSTLRTGGRFDFGGAVGLAAGLVLVLLPISKGDEWGWASPLTLGLIGGGLLTLLVWGWFELRISSPLVDLRVAARRPVLLTNLSSIAIGLAFFIGSSVLPIVLEAPVESEVGMGLSLLMASFCLMPLGVVMFAMSPVSARLSDARGPRTSLVVGALIVALGFGFGVVALGEIWHAILISTLVGAGVGLAYGAMPMLIMRAVPPTETAAANGLNSVMRMLGSAVASTVVGVILAANVDAAGIPNALAFGMVFAIGAVVVLAGAVIAMFIPRRGIGYDTSSIPVQSPRR